jgi:HEPN domain-containing protein
MQNERFPPDDPREWLNRARSNLVRTKEIQPGVYYEDPCFDAQQAAEKALKALLVARDVEVPRTHNLAQVLLLIEQTGVVVPLSIRAATRLSRFAVLSRYPSHGDAVTMADYKEAVAIAETVVA